MLIERLANCRGEVEAKTTQLSLNGGRKVEREEGQFELQASYEGTIKMYPFPAFILLSFAVFRYPSKHPM